MSPSEPRDDRPIYPEDRGKGARIVLVILLLLLLLGGLGAGGWYGYHSGWFGGGDDEFTSQSLPVEPIETTEFVGAPESDDDAVLAGTLSPVEDSEWLESGDFEGEDDDGRKGEFRILILSEDYSWVFESADNIETAAGPAVLSSLFAGDGMKARFCEATHVLSLGTASFEGTAAFNRGLSNDRARQLTEALRQNAPVCDDAAAAPKILAGSLGEYEEARQCPAYRACAEATRPQRRVLLIGVISLEDDINVSEALRDGLIRFDRKEAQFFKNFRINDYDEFRLLN